MPGDKALYDNLVQTGQSATVVTWLLLFAIALLIGAFFSFGWWLTNRHGSRSPYTKTPLARASLLPFSSVQKVHAFLDQIHDADNPFLDLNRAVVCRETGRIFPEAINRFGVITVGWSFLRRRAPGEWISWGALRPEEQQAVFAAHGPLHGFQCKQSSAKPNPQAIDEASAWASPGPCYVDLASKRVMGWKRVPGTELEVLVVQKPKA